VLIPCWDCGTGVVVGSGSSTAYVAWRLMRRLVRNAASKVGTLELVKGFRPSVQSIELVLAVAAVRENILPAIGLASFFVVVSRIPEK
jgi:hypothetical protein